jgi:phage gpG-like protein
MTTQLIIVENNFPKILATMDSRAHDAVRETLFDIKGRSQALMQENKTGIVYRRKNQRQHQASAPGEAPAPDTGNLIASIDTQMTGRTTGMVFTNVEYAAVLEFGGKNMQPRPFFVPATQAAWPAFLAKMNKIAG